MKRQAYGGPLLLILPITGVFLCACSSGNNSTNTAPADPNFNGIFSGQMLFTRGGQTTMEIVSITQTVGSPLNGMYSSTEGTQGDYSGDAVGTSATFSGSTIEGACIGTFSGTMLLQDPNTISLKLVGNDCNGSYNGNAGLTRQPSSGN